MRAATVVVAAAIAATPTATSTAAAAPVPAFSSTDQYVHDALESRATNPLLGRDTTGLVTDAASGRILWSQHRFTRQLPASTTKLITAVNALETFGRAHRFRTRVRQGPFPDRVVLVGAGDPSLRGADLSALAAPTATALKANGVAKVTVYVESQP